MANGYGGTGVTEEEKKDIKGDRLEQGLTTGLDFAAKGAALGAAGGGVGAAIGAGVGFLAGSLYGHFSFDAKAERQKIKQEKNIARARRMPETLRLRPGPKHRRALRSM